MAKVEKSEGFAASKRGLVDALRVEGYATMRAATEVLKPSVEAEEPEVLEFDCPFGTSVMSYGSGWNN